MSNFLEKISDLILSNHGQKIGNISIIIPNKRASVYLQSYLAKRIGKAFQSPEIKTINEWINEHTEFRIVNQTELLFILYEVHTIIEKEQKESFDDFIKWGKILLSDFDEIDRYMISPEAIFKDLRSIKEIENWSFLASELSDGQVKYQTLWDKLIRYHTLLNEILTARNLTYQGLAYNHFATEINQQKIAKAHYYFVGFNALSKSEEAIIHYLIQEKRGSIHFDVDDFYVSNLEHEAGHFYRKHSHLQSGEPIPNIINSIPKKIEIIETAQQTTQTKIAGQFADQLFASEQNLNDTAIVLADESLLIPLTRSLPSKIAKANITMGYPIKFSHLKSLIDTLFDFQFNFQKFGSNRIYHKTILTFIDHNYIQLLIGDEKKRTEFEQDLLIKNRIFITWDEFANHFPSLSALKGLLHLWKNPLVDGFAAFNILVQELYNAFNGKQNHDIDLEIIYHFAKGFKRFEEIATTYPQSLNLKSFKKLFYQFWQEESLSFLGNPIEGLQVMGILETRTLDFKNLIILGMNEGNLPQTNVINSLIPRDLKLFHALPVEEDRQAIFAHHFYRLIQRAENIFMTYNSSAESMGSNEKSRFITQLENELLPKYGHVINSSTYTSKDKGAEISTISYQSSSSIQTKLDERLANGLSPSALNKLITCPLDFYYRYILDMKENNSVEENIEASTFGTKIHEVIERLMRDNFFSAGKPLSAEILEKEKKHIGKYLEEEYLKDFRPSDLKYGQNKLSLEVSVQFIHDFIDQQIKEINTSPFPIFIKELEKNISATYHWTINGAKKKIVLSGNADRIDQIGSIYRIIDYKSGKCDAKKIGINDKIGDAGQMEKFMNNSDAGYGRQLLMYALMFRQTFPDYSSFAAGIISMINIKDWLQYPKTNKDKIPLITDELLHEFELELADKIAELYAIDYHFEHNRDAKYCEHCSV
jgi:ATP-dependent helicase/nuclease subunit B